jgi:NAD+ diphosphatase
MHFVPRTIITDAGQAPAYWFIFRGDQLLVRPGDEAGPVQRLAGPSELDLIPLREEYLGYLEDELGQRVDCYCAEVPADSPLPQGMVADGLRQLFGALGETLSAVAGRAVQVLAWDRTHQFCGQCGTPTVRLAQELAKQCRNCGLISYPRISPAIIIAVVRRTGRGRELLLARNHRFPPGRYSVIAGYVEPGESLEECAEREVCEEVGLDITNIRYFGSQPWPFPHSLMIGFTAEYAGGEVKPEEAELADARWFTTEELPDLPPRTTIARRLIDWFVGNP